MHARDDMQVRRLFGLLALAVATGLALTGCTSLEYPRPHHQEVVEGVDALSHTADLRTTYFFKKGDKVWILTEPAPDAAFSYESEEGLSFSLISTGSSEKEEISEGAEDLPLTGRASYIVLARTLSYRLAEAAYNYDLTWDQYQTSYKQILDVVETVAKIEAQQIKQETSVQLNTGVTSDLSVKTLKDLLQAGRSQPSQKSDADTDDDNDDDWDDDWSGDDDDDDIDVNVDDDDDDDDVW